MRCVARERVARAGAVVGGVVAPELVTAGAANETLGLRLARLLRPRLLRPSSRPPRPRPLFQKIA